MSQDKVTRETIAKQISIEFGIAYSSIYKKIDRILEIWGNEITNSDSSISNIGSFKIKKKNDRIGRNPKNGERVAVPRKKSVYYKPGKELKERINSSS